ncbi:hypothetical protein AB6A40_001941 [Gnathostoma spinigerum]|uniref:Uncharacterized protein n=1 Tax=Gnathostoma spinigerum TaxID=75299 RepID=A0ABD6EFC9_9BILA
MCRSLCRTLTMMAKEEEEKDTEMTGTCKWFNVIKGYGFIIADNTNDDVFVHQSELHMPGFRSLESGERVRFRLRSREEGLEAFNVRGVEKNGELMGSSIRPLGKSKARLIRCFSCGHYGKHVALKCKALPTPRNVKLCYNCHSKDHLAAECPLKLSNHVATSNRFCGKSK